MAAELARYAAQSGITAASGRFRLRTRVETVRRDRDGWRVTARTDDEAARTGRVDHVVVASGRFRTPRLPSLTGVGIVTGQRVLVVGSAISALEIASELAVDGAAQVVPASRTQRYVLRRLAAGVPVDHFTWTRYGAVLGERSPAEAPPPASRRSSSTPSAAPSRTARSPGTTTSSSPA